MMRRTNFHIFNNNNRKPITSSSSSSSSSFSSLCCYSCRYISSHSSTIINNSSNAQKTSVRYSKNNIYPFYSSFSFAQIISSKRFRHGQGHKHKQSSSSFFEEKHPNEQQNEPFFRRVSKFWKNYWFPLLIPIVVFFNLAYPGIFHPDSEIGLLHSESWRFLVVPTMFLSAGLTVKKDVMIQAASALRFHSFIQVFSLLACPMIGFAVVKFLENFCFNLRQEYVTGLLFVCCLPTTIGLSTAVARTLHADVPLTIVNSVLGNLLGIIFTPLMFVLLTGYQTEIDSLSVTKKLTATVVLPLLLGVMFRGKIFKNKKVEHAISPYLGIYQQCCILTMLSIVVSKEAKSIREHCSFSDVPRLFISTVLLYSIFFHCCLISSRFLVSASEAQRVAMTLSGTQKTAAMGISIIQLLFENDASLPLVTLPLLFFHPGQVGMSQLMAVNAMRRGWAKNSKNFHFSVKQ